MSYIAIDTNHINFIYGAAVAKKPKNILELGIGSALVTHRLAQAIRYNQCGKLTSVDNWHDWGGIAPGLALPAEAQVVTSTESNFVYQAVTDTYDFLVSDADHSNSGTWFHEHCRIVQHDGFMFFHDTNQEHFTTLFTIIDKVRALNLPHFHFTESSLKDERCERGFLFVVNKK